ncbi:gamma-aminobutyric acid type B receptor subunit 2-like [Oppia nitens]|uniref:gamma-aminobutyric acid type B receptor subunit 2-like n=1 Tax=Oppia nitens TaxID=1686743 RepID=UPI0023DA9425|nr:gamma-aminobutyric acid type B receptor subunit 2-like [Oppia nitens]
MSFWWYSYFIRCLWTAYVIPLAIICNANIKTEKLYIAGFFPTSNDIIEGSIGRGVLPAVKLALNHINSSPVMNRGYDLDIVWNNTKCDAAQGMKEFFNMLYFPPIKVLLFGDACPVVTDPIAKASKFFNLIQLTYADKFTALTPNFFRIVPSEAAFNPARVSLLKHFNWTRVGTIYQNSPQYSLPHSKLLADLDRANIDIVSSQSIADELKPDNYLQKFKINDVRIILGNFGEEWGQKIFCQAYRDGLYGRRYQWIVSGLYEDKWWQNVHHLDCSEKELMTALDGYISTDVLPLTSSQTTDFGLTTYEYEAEYSRMRKQEYSRYHGYAYDGIWAIALAIRSVHEKLKSMKSGLTLKDFTYREPFWAQLFREALNETQFNGVTGRVSFDKNERRGVILLKQFQGHTEHKIGEYLSYSESLEFKDSPISWRGSLTPPRDSTTFTLSPSRISITLFIIISVLAIMGIVLAGVFLAMNIKYRNQRYIKMSSPYLNNLIIIGCILTYTSVILLGLDSNLTNESIFPYICAARAWVLMSGFTLAFGSMFSKTWRVHAIFTNIKLNKKLIKDYKLFMVVGVLVFIDVATLTTWQIVDPFYRVTQNGTAEQSPQNEDIWVIPEMEYCQSKRMTIFLGSIYVYKGLLMAFGIFLAWETRHVSIPALNDSKYIGMSVYNVVIMCVIGAGLSFVLRDQQDAAFVIISIFIIFCSTATLCLVFVPKLIELKRNPMAGDRRVRATLKPFKKSRRDSDEMEVHHRIKAVTEDNFRFRQRLKEKAYELEALTFRFRGLEESSLVITKADTQLIGSIVTNVDIGLENVIIIDKDKQLCEDKQNDKECQKWSHYDSIKVTSVSASSSISLSPNVVLDHKMPLPQPKSCHQMIEQRVDKVMNVCEVKQSSSELLSLRALSLIDKQQTNSNNTRIKFSSNTSQNNSDKSTESSVNSSISYKQSDFLSAVSVEEQYIQIESNSRDLTALESEDTSYAKAIRLTSHKYNNNDFSSYDDEDNYHYEQSQQKGLQLMNRNIRRRAHSLGGLQTNIGESVSFLSKASVDALNVTPNAGSNYDRSALNIESTFIRLFPYLNRNNEQNILRTGSSCPHVTVRCDIVEYL